MATDPTTVRTDLASERDDLERRLAELTADGSAAPDFDENFADSAQVTAEQVENATLAATLRDQLSDVEDALARIDAGTYGSCEVCGAAIAPARLEAMPATRFCIDHA
ncbi:MAG: TraR/DksA C4-type zinc finger protein [Acidimicrobiales bacterium]|nr:TraR/DksA C4-type zinc finger protein [Acidimicrobiales bacterium]HRW38857.1 TraR/DksA C4-type zinc finger protein [Aquihabitans sp.]